MLKKCTLNIELQTKRLRILTVSYEDLEQIHQLHSFPETDRFNTLGIPDNLEQTRHILREWIRKGTKKEGKQFTFKLVSVENEEFVGLMTLVMGISKFRIAEVWYKIHPSYWSLGYATESLKKVLEFGFVELELHRIQAGCAVGNLASARVLEKVGMVREGRKRKVLPLKEGWSDNFHYAILETDFLGNTPNSKKK